MSSYDEAPAGTGASSENMVVASGVDDTAGVIGVSGPSSGSASALPLGGVAFPKHRSLLGRIMRSVSAYHLVDDAVPYLFSVAVAVSAALDGSPLWGMLIGPPSGGKTEALNLIAGVADEQVDTMTAPSLMSWSKPRGRGPSHEVGVLVRVGERGLVTIGDLSTVLAGSDRGGRDDLFAMLRRVFDGRVQRELGNEDRPLIWEGRLTLLAACTAAIDNYSSHSDALGPRWVYLRLEARSPAMKQEVTKRALAAKSVDQDRDRKRAQMLTKVLVVRAAEVVDALEVSEQVLNEIREAAMVVCYGRASVPRDAGQQREIDGIPEMEEPPRVAKQLLMLFRCLSAIGLTDEEAILIVSRVAIDSMTAMRAEVLGALAASTGSVTSADVAKAVGTSWKAANRAMEDFEAIRLVRHAMPAEVNLGGFQQNGAAESKPWILDHEDGGLVRRVFDRGTDARAANQVWEL